MNVVSLRNSVTTAILLQLRGSVLLPEETGGNINNNINIIGTCTHRG